jgi:hypothetical protein
MVVPSNPRTDPCAPTLAGTLTKSAQEMIGTNTNSSVRRAHMGLDDTAEPPWSLAASLHRPCGRRPHGEKKCNVYT